jgi:hypothetical protein
MINNNSLGSADKIILPSVRKALTILLFFRLFSIFFLIRKYRNKLYYKKTIL